MSCGVQLARAEGKAPATLSSYENKLGGLPDWPPSLNVDFQNGCKLCGLPRPMVFQCYAPLADSPYHRTIYIFACINPSCGNDPSSWSCIRVQHKDQVKHNDITTEQPAGQSVDPWCIDSDDWEDAVNGNDTVTIKNVPDDHDMDELATSTANLNCSNVQSRLHELKERMEAASASNLDKSDQVIAEALITPQCDVNAILNQKPDLPDDLKKGTNDSVQFESMYVSVYDEYLSDELDDHAADLLRIYKLNNDFHSPSDTAAQSDVKFVDEGYEKAVPLHGDKMFHYFINRIRMNPDQIVRYSLGGEILLQSPISQHPKSINCSRCKGTMQFEMQILPTMIPLLRLVGRNENHLEYGNVIVYTCKNSCWRDGDRYVEEYVIVQYET